MTTNFIEKYNKLKTISFIQFISNLFIAFLVTLCILPIGNNFNISSTTIEQFAWVFYIFVVIIIVALNMLASRIANLEEINKMLIEELKNKD